MLRDAYYLNENGAPNRKFRPNFAVGCTANRPFIAVLDLSSRMWCSTSALGQLPYRDSGLSPTGVPHGRDALVELGVTDGNQSLAATFSELTPDAVSQ
jgi:hypothetical protein